MDLGLSHSIHSVVQKKQPILGMAMRSLAAEFVSTLQSTTSPQAGSSTHPTISPVTSGALLPNPMPSHLRLLLPTILQYASFFRCFDNLFHGFMWPSNTSTRILLCSH